MLLCCQKVLFGSVVLAHHDPRGMNGWRYFAFDWAIPTTLTAATYRPGQDENAKGNSIHGSSPCRSACVSSSRTKKKTHYRTRRRRHAAEIQTKGWSSENRASEVLRPVPIKQHLNWYSCTRGACGKTCTAHVEQQCCKRFAHAAQVEFFWRTSSTTSKIGDGGGVF